MPEPVALATSLLGDYVGFTQPKGMRMRKRDPIYTAGQMRAYGQAMAEHARSGAAKKLAAYAMLVKSMEARLTDAGKLRDAHAEAVRTLQSERDANAILTAENAGLASAAQEARRVALEEAAKLCDDDQRTFMIRSEKTAGQKSDMAFGRAREADALAGLIRAAAQTQGGT
jgi:hypothetical protein